MRIRLRDIADEIRNTYVPNPEDDLPYIGLEYVEPGSLHISGIGSSREVESHKFKFRTGDILFSTLRPYFRKVVIAPCDGVCSTEFCVVRPKQDSDRYFVFYGMAHPQFIKFATTNSKGARPRTKWKLFSGYELPEFLSPRRRDMGSILSTYDNLIENNRRRIQLLEAAARLLYKEWFVHLRFPGHEHVKITRGVPDGWERKVLGDVCFEVRETVDPKSLEPNTPYIGLEHMPRRSIALADWDYAEKVTSSKHRFREGEILFGKIRPYFHKVGIALTDGIASSDAIVIRPASSQLLALVLMTTSSDGFIAVTAQQMKEGSKMPRADWKQMQQYPLPQPPEGILRAFNGFIEPILTQLKTLSFSNRQLNAARDLLLPRLMNGEVAV